MSPELAAALGAVLAALAGILRDELERRRRRLGLVATRRDDFRGDDAP